MARLDPLDSRRAPPGCAHQPHPRAHPHCNQGQQQQQQQQQGNLQPHSNGAAAHASQGPHSRSSDAPARLRRAHFFCISPDACTNPTLYYLGDYLEPEEVGTRLGESPLLVLAPQQKRVCSFAGTGPAGKARVQLCGYQPRSKSACAALRVPAPQ